MEQKVGIIDLGSNTVRLVIMKITEDGAYTLLDEQKETVRLDASVEAGGLLEGPAVEHAVDTIRLFKRLCDVNGVTRIIGLATAAVRKARNKQRFIELVQQQTGVSFSVISGMQEAEYDYIGVVNSTSIEDGLIVDIGGGSTELVRFEHRRLVHATSMPFGAITLTDSFLGRSKPKPDDVNRLNEFIHSKLREHAWVAFPDATLVGVGGTIRNVAKIHQAKSNYRLPLLHGYAMPFADIKSLWEDMQDTTVSQRKKMRGLSDDRADIFLGGMAALVNVLEFSHIDNVVVSGNGVREGAFYKEVLGWRGGDRDVLDTSIENILKIYNVNVRHAQYVARLSIKLFDQLATLHGCGNDFKKILYAAARLHDVGTALNYYNHSQHTLYIILNSQIYGFTHRELVLCALIAASHHKDMVKSYARHYEGILYKDDAEKAQRMSAILRLAESMDRSESGVVKDVICSISDDYVKLETVVNGDGVLELADADNHRSYFKKIYDKDIHIAKL
ncbi:Ppx/GppA phosphatase family protein [Mahella australiensis]|uniref:Ppx/GppA phosphatase n=1 Tax=Mahella australiensis (strain DSM 15567 / CIP 107919 / 50-1 BON) TaxID=697281 RepID=F3ZXA1_MAHA5|nr:Ppx/GppA phosphatase family protein [Mahella australiensis]AEE96558.1 Ppx/GppA phosphatase [Mahella australiensis 50-1 BON]